MPSHLRSSPAPRRVLVFVQATLLAVSLSFAPAAPAAAAVTLTFNPTADAYVSSALPSANFGTATTLQVEGTPSLHPYLMFNVQGVSGAISSATLRLYAVTAGSGASARSTTLGWTETGITNANAPAYGVTPVSTVSNFTAGSWLSFNVTSLVTGNGTVAFAYTSASKTAISFASREDTAHAPQLIVIAAGVPTLPAGAVPDRRLGDHGHGQRRHRHQCAGARGQLGSGER